jgi:hypothetical protein
VLISFKRGQGSIVLRVKIFDSTVTTGAGKTGLTSASSGLIISTIVDNEASATTYTVAGSTIESITTLGTYSAPTATKCRFKEVDATNHKGIYELQIADARFAVSSAKSLLISISGATGGAECDVLVPLRDVDPYDAVRAGLTALPNVASGSAGAIPTTGTGANQISVSSGQVIIQAGSGTGQLDFTSGVVKANVTQFSGTTSKWGTNAPGDLHTGTAQAGGSDTITLASGASATNDLYRGCCIAVISGTGAGQARVVVTYVGSTKVATVDGAWTTNPDSSSVYAVRAIELPNIDRGASTGALMVRAGNQAGDYLLTDDTFASWLSDNSVNTRLANLDAAVSSRMATYTQPTGFLAATFPSGTIANTTNITAGTITTVTNLTNAPTAGDFTATMKTSLNASTPASVTGAVGSVTGNLGGNVTGSVGSIASGGISLASFAADTGLTTIRSGTAQAGAAGTITLDASASATTDFYKGDWIYITGATGVGQARLCTAYNGTTKVATIVPNWATNPDNTSTFAVLPAASVEVDDKTGFSLSSSQAFNLTGNITGNLSGSVGSIGAGGIAASSFASGAIDATAFAQGAADKVWSTAARTVTGGTITTYTGNTPQTGDAYAVVNDGTFGNSKLVRATTPANTLDVSSTGEAGLDFNNIKDATGAHTLTNITVPTVTTTATATAVTTVNGLASSVITAASIATDAITAAKLASDVGTEIATAVFANTVDGLAFSSISEAMLAFIAGKSSVTDNGDGTFTVVFKKQNGTSAKISITYATATSARSSTSVS